MFEMMAGRSPFDIITDNPDMNTEDYLFQGAWLQVIHPGPGALQAGGVAVVAEVHTPQSPAKHDRLSQPASHTQDPTTLASGQGLASGQWACPDAVVPVEPSGMAGRSKWEPRLGSFAI